MVRAAEIRDEASLRAWLEGRPQEDAVAVAVRVALRVAPVLWQWANAYSMLHAFNYRHSGNSGERPARLPIVTDIRYRRLLLAVCVAAERDTEESRRALRQAAQRAEILGDMPEQGWHNDAVSVFAERHYLIGQGVPGNAGTTLLDISGAPSAARLSAFNAVSAILNREAAPALAAASAARLLQATFGHTTATRDQIEAAWALIAADVADRESAAPVSSRPLQLWHINARPPSRWGGGWEFWADWYEGYLKGQPLDIDLLEEVARIESEHWDKGDDHVNRIIAAIYEEWKAQQADIDRPQFNLALVERQTVVLRDYIIGELERVRSKNSVSDEDLPRVELIKDLLRQALEAVDAILERLEAPGAGQSTALTIVEEKLPVLVEAAEKLATEAQVPKVSDSILALAASAKVLIDAGLDPRDAAKFASAEVLGPKIIAWFRSWLARRK